MKFDNFQYQRPAMESFEQRYRDCLEGFETANTFEEQDRLFGQINALRQQYATMYNICHIRHTINTKDKFFEAENNFYDEYNPSVEALTNRFYHLLLKSRFRKELERKWGDQLFVIAELSLKTFKPVILEDLKEENRLTSEYVKIKASAEIVF